MTPDAEIARVLPADVGRQGQVRHGIEDDDGQRFNGAEKTEDFLRAATVSRRAAPPLCRTVGGRQWRTLVSGGWDESCRNGQGVCPRWPIVYITREAAFVQAMSVPTALLMTAKTMSHQPRPHSAWPRT